MTTDGTDPNRLDTGSQRAGATTAAPAIMHALATGPHEARGALSDLMLGPALGAIAFVKTVFWSILLPFLVGIGAGGLLGHFGFSRSAVIVSCWLLALTIGFAGLVLALLGFRSEKMLTARHEVARRVEAYRLADDKSTLEKSIACKLVLMLSWPWLRIVLLAVATITMVLATAAIGAACGIWPSELQTLATAPTSMRPIRIVRIVTWIGTLIVFVPYATEAIVLHLAARPENSA